MKINEFERIEGWHVHPEGIDTAGFQCRYPWAQMRPGAVISIFDTAASARSRLSAGAAQAGKRLGKKFSTGTLYDEDSIHVGWWAARVDGCTIKPKASVMMRDYARDQMRADRLKVKRDREAERRAKPHRPQRVKPLGVRAAESAGMLAGDVLPAIDYATADLSDWQTPVPVAGEATEGEAF